MKERHVDNLTILAKRISKDHDINYININFKQVKFDCF